MKRLAAYCLLLATLAAGMIPAGWMPAQTDGKMLLVLCTTDGVQETWVDIDASDEHAPMGEQMEDRSCPFAAPVHVALLPSAEIPLPRMPALAAQWAQMGFTHHTAGFHWRYDARGPPAFS
ncbi:hypothetical protein TRM7557_01415 [Tritonibacter multivorans]|uniref:DUF2946 domain-containing protein n=1 Tax=Tritonibacter multivorans TaxID=928856 RepID=A0A0N7LZF5_9RHOB|nr:DUF2946 family protein [Tritonibacter multivorans]MDA7421200.1 DUF2946 domain-containing protein [Tritonibacter multivorans]CUH77521.1 hypothetical protein TRM7557_01415 [Tritonibacter multivorans]SFD33265.1 hypothetical protein SAMN04488049_11173 [Tritonibacter multivorans]